MPSKPVIIQVEIVIFLERNPDLGIVNDVKESVYPKKQAQMCQN